MLKEYISSNYFLQVIHSIQEYTVLNLTVTKYMTETQNIPKYEGQKKDVHRIGFY